MRSAAKLISPKAVWWSRKCRRSSLPRKHVARRTPRALRSFDTYRPYTNYTLCTRCLLALARHSDPLPGWSPGAGGSASSVGRNRPRPSARWSAGLGGPSKAAACSIASSPTGSARSSPPSLQRHSGQATRIRGDSPKRDRGEPPTPYAVHAIAWSPPIRGDIPQTIRVAHPIDWVRHKTAHHPHYLATRLPCGREGRNLQSKFRGEDSAKRACAYRAKPPRSPLSSLDEHAKGRGTIRRRCSAATLDMSSHFACTFF